MIQTMKKKIALLTFSALLGSLVGLQGCGSSNNGTELVGYKGKTPPDSKQDASVEATFLNFEFDGQLICSYSYNIKQQVQNQMLYMLGHLNGDNSVCRLDKMELSNTQTTTLDDGKVLISYHAKMPVAWGKLNQIPTTYTIKIPKDNTYEGLEAFTEKYKTKCVDWSAHGVDSSSMWYYYRPSAYSCNLDAADIVETIAQVTPSSIRTTGKYPEYYKVWEDNTLKVVAIFGKYESGATSSGDAGIAAFNEFVAETTSALASYNPTTNPPNVPTSPGVNMPDIEFFATLADGKKIEVAALLVNSIQEAGPDFDERFAVLSTPADFIAYNGHSGLGANVRALTRKGRWTTGQYAIVFMNGCDTYAYVDSALWVAHANVNSDDPVGTKYLDIVMNAMPAYFHSDSEATMAIIQGLLSYDNPKTYEKIFEDIDSSQVVLVSGEQDNVYYPGYPGGEPGTWTGLDESGTVAKSEEKRYETPILEAGNYTFEITGTNDADLYVRVGTAPTAQNYDCRPYLTTSNETCKVALTSSAPIHVMVRGWASTSDFHLVGSID